MKTNKISLLSQTTIAVKRFPQNEKAAPVRFYEVKGGLPTTIVSALKELADYFRNPHLTFTMHVPGEAKLPQTQRKPIHHG